MYEKMEEKMKLFTLILVSLYGLCATANEDTKLEKITLKDAMENAYKTNQQLGQAEYELKSSHENLSTAKREWFPEANISTSGSYGFSYQEQKNPRFPSNDSKNNSQSNSATAQIQVKQNIFNGGATSARIKGNKRNVDGTQAKYRSAESALFLNVVKVYSEYVKKLSIYNLSKANQIVLEESLAVAKNQYELGEKTISDVASTQAKLDEAKARVTAAKAELGISISNFERIVGFLPTSEMANPEGFKNVPATKEEAKEIALKYNYDIHIADAAADTAREQTKIARKDLLPSLDIQATGSRTLQGNWDKQYPGNFSKARTNSLQTTATLSIPLDFRGAVQSSVRSQKYTAAQKRMEALYKRREVADAVISAWEKYKSSLARIKQFKSQVKATKIAFDSTNEEFNVGSKTTLEVLTAENEYFQAQINLVAAREDYVQNSYELAHVIGLLNPTTLDLQVEKFIPNEHKESRPVWGLGIEKDRRGYKLDT
jgi:TolC family type I secretion outer membrane protein